MNIGAVSRAREGYRLNLSKSEAAIDNAKQMPSPLLANVQVDVRGRSLLLQRNSSERTLGISGAIRARTRGG